MSDPAVYNKKFW